MCAPAAYGGSAAPSARRSSKLRTSSASMRRPTTRTSSTAHPVLENEGLAAEPRFDHPLRKSAVPGIRVLGEPARQLEGGGGRHAPLAGVHVGLHPVPGAQLRTV